MRRWMFGLACLLPVVAVAADERAEALAALRDCLAGLVSGSDMGYRFAP